METENSTFKIPGLERKEAYNFDSVYNISEVYQELNKINEEIEECRLKNS
ncbi:hypothetical protein IJI29_00355 [Candidatus Saccharibacteria bacterium]|nr:hypothetical protein [Candidatus Saccharibacteria bacterium]